MKKLLMLILCLGLTFAFGACDLFNDTTSSNSQTESLESIDNSKDSSENSSDTTDNSSDDSSDVSSGDSSEDSSKDSSSDSSEDSSSDSSDDSSTVTPPIIDGDNEMPLVPIG